MPRRTRDLIENEFYHVYNRGVEKRTIFEKEGDYRLFVYLLSKVVSESGIKLFAYCLMGNHFHLYVQNCQAMLQIAMRKLQGPYAQYFNCSYDRVGPLFQGRFKSKWVAADSYSLQVMRYIHRNPMESRTVSRLADYPWSSYSAYLSDRKTPWLDTDWILSQFSNSQINAKKLFSDFHEGQVDPAPKGQDVPAPLSAASLSATF